MADGQVVLIKLLLSLVLLGLSAFFAGAETALLSLSRIRLARLHRAHPGLLNFWEKDPDDVLAVLLLGNNLTLVGLGVLSTSLALEAEHLYGLPFVWGAWVAPAVTVIFVIIFGEILPKVLARNYPGPVAQACASTVHGLTAVLKPFVMVVVALADVVLAVLSRIVPRERRRWRAAQVGRLLLETPLAPPLRSMLSNLLTFGQLPVSKVMIGRESLFALDLSLPKEEFMKKILDADYSRVPVYRGALEKTEGIVYAKDLLSAWRSEALIFVDDLVRPALMMNEQTPLVTALREFRAGRHHMALVVNKSGTVVGLVTLQDILETIVGEIPEEPSLESVRAAASS